jgi:hypothetical protein
LDRANRHASIWHVGDGAVGLIACLDGMNGTDDVAAEGQKNGRPGGDNDYAS